MAKKVSAWKQIYREAIEFMGGETTKRMSLKSLKHMWQSIRKEHKKEGTELPSVRTVAKEAREYVYEETPRDEEMNTLPLEQEEATDKGYEYIENFKKQLENILNDTRAWAGSWKDKSITSEDRRHRYMCYNSLDLLESTYYAILTKLDNLIMEYGYDVVADAIAGDIEFDYSIALSFMPPSSVINEMAITLEQINGIMNKLTVQYENI